MLFTPPLLQAKLLKRYKRFLADIILSDGTETTLHVANTGAMTGCAEPGDTVCYSTSANEKRKYPFSWELTKTVDNHLICVNTIRANQLIEEALNTNIIAELINYPSIQREVKYGSENSKIDFLLSGSKQPNAYVEVKSVTLLAGEQGYFPDAVTTRGQKHLRELIEVAQQGHRAVLLFAVLHSGIHSVKIAKHIDKKYNELIITAKKSGVEILAYKADIELSPQSTKIVITEAIDIII